MAEPNPEATIDVQRIILRDRSGKVRGEWSAEFGHTSLVLFGADEKPRISMKVEESEVSNFRDTYLGEVVFCGQGGTPTMHLQGFDNLSRLSLLDSKGDIRASLAMFHLNDLEWPEFMLADANKWRMMLIVRNAAPHIILYDDRASPRIHMFVDRRGTPHIRRYWWKRFIPYWLWSGYYPREGTEG